MNRINRTSVFLFFVLLLGTVAGAFAQQGDWDAYEINAQYRGGVKQGFEGVGCAMGYYTDLSNQKSQVIFHGCVQHPEKKKEFYNIQLNIAYAPEKGGCQVIDTVYSKFAGLEDQYQEQIRNFLLLLPILRKDPQALTELTELHINNQKFPFSAKKVRKNQFEASLKQPGQTPVETKFFYKSSDDGKTFKLEKFHVRRGKISLSFVGTTMDSITKEYKTRSPWDKIVFTSDVK